MNTIFKALAILFFLFISCSSVPEEVIEETYPDGSPKKAVIYQKKNKEKIKKGETAFYEDGTKKYTGSYNENGRREGHWVYWYKNGKIWSECDYSNGIKNGKTIIYYESGQKRYEGQYKNDQKTGIWNFWDGSGNLETTLNYE